MRTSHKGTENQILSSQNSLCSVHGSEFARFVDSNNNCGFPLNFLCQFFQKMNWKVGFFKKQLTY